MAKGKLFVLSAPSGAGKTTVLLEVMKRVQGVSFSVSQTTREPREGEVDGVDYHFVSTDEFLKSRDNGDFLEYANVHGNLYGTSRQAVVQQIDSGMDVILDIDVQGAELIRKVNGVSAVYLFLAPPGLDELEKRLRNRGLDSEETITTRLHNARKEMRSMRDFTYLIVNERVEDAVSMFVAVILAERARDRRDIHGKALTEVNFGK